METTEMSREEVLSAAKFGITARKEEFPLIAERLDTPFFEDLVTPPMSVNGKPMSRAVWNLIITQRDLRMWVGHKMKPHRHWKVGQVKTYFGLKGTGQTLLDRFLALKVEVDKLHGIEQ